MKSFSDESSSLHQVPDATLDPSSKRTPGTTPAPSIAVRKAVLGQRLPALVVDLDAVDANASDLVRRAGGKPIRVASKSLRIPELISYVLAKPGFQGVLAYSLAEALYLFHQGISTDILVAYPTVDRVAIAELSEDKAASAAIALMVDCPEHLEFITAHAHPDNPIRVCIDVDASWKPVRGIHIGTLRSPIHSPKDAATLAKEIRDTPGLELVGLMMYEGHIAGVGDKGRSLRSRAIRLMQKLSRKELAARRAKVVAAVTNAVGPVWLVNGGGTGSLESTCAEAVVTEAAAGSGLLAPTLFDGYRAFTPRPACWFLTPVVRKPRFNTVTTAGGGRIASGPAGADRLPVPVFPPGLSYAPDEGPGEVQTPLIGKTAELLSVGDHVWFRHAKAGEAAEHANQALAIKQGKIHGRWATYRGEGLLFT